MDRTERFRNIIRDTSTTFWQNKPKFYNHFKVGYAVRIEFIDENGGGPGVRLRKRQRAKKPK
jgi:hypothetical protein